MFRGLVKNVTNLEGWLWSCNGLNFVKNAIKNYTKIKQTVIDVARNMHSGQTINLNYDIFGV